MKSVLNLASFVTRIPASIVDKLRPAASRRSELSMKLAGVGDSQVRLTAWKFVDSERLRWNDAVPYSHYKLPRLEVKSVTVEPRSERFGEYFIPRSPAPARSTPVTIITGVKERAI